MSLVFKIKGRVFSVILLKATPKPFSKVFTNPLIFSAFFPANITFIPTYYSILKNYMQALKISTFRSYLFGSFLSETGNQMQTVAVAWQIYEITRNPVSLGLIGVANL